MEHAKHHHPTYITKRHPSCNTEYMHGSGAFRKCGIAFLPSRFIPHWMHSYKLEHVWSFTRWHKVCGVLVTFWPHAWASARVRQREVRLLHDLSIIHGFLHEEVLAPRTILPLLLAVLCIPPPALTRVDVVRLELLQEPLHTSLTTNLKIAEIAHKNFVACLNVRSGRCLWVLRQAGLEYARQENSGNVCLHSPREFCICALSFDLSPCTHEERCIQVFFWLVLPKVLRVVRSGLNHGSGSPSDVNRCITEYA